MVMVDHLGLQPGCAELALITGDASRLPVLGEIFRAAPVSERRGFVCHVAPDWNRPLALVATGIGGPATAIVVEELIALGIRAIVRIGTCGSLQTEVRPDDLVVSTGCVREDGTSRAYIDPAFPALPDPGLSYNLAKAADAQSVTVHRGITHCKDAYYSERRSKQLDFERSAQRWNNWRAAGVLATEMEAAPLFIIATLRRTPAAAILIAVGKEQSVTFRRSLIAAGQACAQAFRELVDTGTLDKIQPNCPQDEGSFLDFKQDKH